MSDEEACKKTGDKPFWLTNKRVVINGEVYFEKWFEDGTLFSRIKKVETKKQYA